jgi:hypothetical protein
MVYSTVDYWIFSTLSIAWYSKIKQGKKKNTTFHKLDIFLS